MNLLVSIAKTAAVTLMALAVAGCRKDNPDGPANPERRVLLFYECAFNDIGSFMKTNMDDEGKGLPAGYIPEKGEDVVLVYSRTSKSNSDYTPVKSYLRRLYRTGKGKFVSDTVKVFGEETIAASSSTMRDVLNLVREEFPAKGYGMVFSSHGSGWLPAGYYSNPSKFESERGNKVRASAQAAGKAALPDKRMLPVPEGSLADTDPYYGMTRSIGQDFIKDSYIGHEMDVREFSDGIPYHLDYILFDMCFTGGVELAYALRDKADYLGLSPAEVIGEGIFDYTKLTSFLLKGDKPDLESLFEDSFNLYNNQTGAWRSATVNVIRTDGMENLAGVCSRLIKEYSDTLSKAPANDIQGYFRSNRHYFYDLVDIFGKCGASRTDMAELENAVDRCVIYKNATPGFLDLFSIDTYSGFSMYLPCAGTELLDEYYKKEAWNDATGLVR